jgi:hypothetical protein
LISSKENNEISETEGARRASVDSEVTAKRAVADSEVKLPLKRNRHTDSFKKEVIAHAAELRKADQGEIGSYLRSKGIYASMVRKWEKNFKSENKSVGSTSREKALEDKVKMLQSELEVTRKKLVKSELIIEFQKKISRLLEPE